MVWKYAFESLGGYMRPISSGSITFGLINIPVNLYTGVYSHGISLDMLHKKDLSPIRYAKICKAEDKEVPYEEIVKGYEYAKGEYVVLTEEDFIKINPKKSKAIEIASFINEDEVDPVYYDKPYFLEPGKGAGKTYVLLVEALKKAKKVGVATYIMHTKSHIGLIKPYGRGLILEQLRFHSEVRNFSEIELPVAKIQPKEMEVAVQLIEQLTEPFKIESYKDTSREMLQEIIDEKTKGKKVTKKKEEEPAITGVKDIMSQLKASLRKYPSSGRRTRIKKAAKR